MARLIELKMPRLDPLMEEGIVVEWLKKPGDVVEEGETIAIIEGEKTTFELQSPYSGRLVKIIAQPKSVVKVGEPIAEIEISE
jgi:pyruvate/2-oxoglutarate dehydrogenase complex dihydrolipoamide acyltransferase (E2) component